MPPAEAPPSLRIVILGTDALLEVRPLTPIQLARACMKAGFDFVAPVSWGEELLAMQVIDAVKRTPPAATLILHCPFVGEALRDRGDALPPCIRAVSPPVATARYLRAVFGPKALHITYAGACPGANGNEIDACVLPRLLVARLVEAGAAPESEPPYFEEMLPPDRARYASVPGGIPEPSLLFRLTGAQLREAAPATLLTVAMSSESAAPVVIDLEAAAGCVCARDRFSAAQMDPPRSLEPVLSLESAVDLTEPRSPVTPDRVRSEPEFSDVPTVVPPARTPVGANGEDHAIPRFEERAPAPPAPPTRPVPEPHFDLSAVVEPWIGARPPVETSPSSVDAPAAAPRHSPPTAKPAAAEPAPSRVASEARPASLESARASSERPRIIERRVVRDVEIIERIEIVHAPADATDAQVLTSEALEADAWLAATSPFQQALPATIPDVAQAPPAPPIGLAVDPLAMPDEELPLAPPAAVVEAPVATESAPNVAPEATSQTSVQTEAQPSVPVRDERVVEPEAATVEPASPAAESYAPLREAIGEIQREEQRARRSEGLRRTGVILLAVGSVLAGTLVVSLLIGGPRGALSPEGSAEGPPRLPALEVVAQPLDSAAGATDSALPADSAARSVRPVRRDTIPGDTLQRATRTGRTDTLPPP